MARTVSGADRKYFEQSPVTPAPSSTAANQPTDRRDLASKLAADLFGVNVSEDGLFGGAGGDGGGGVGRFSSLPYQLRSFDIQRQEYDRALQAFLRENEQGRKEALEDVNRNALRRGIVRSGIRTRNRNRTNRDYREQAGDERERIRLALEQLQNQENLARAAEAHAAKAHAAAGSGGGGGSLTPGQLQSYMIDLVQLAEAGGLAPDLTSRVFAIDMITRGGNRTTPVGLDPDRTLQ